MLRRFRRQVRRRRTRASACRPASPRPAPSPGSASRRSRRRRRRRPRSAARSEFFSSMLQRPSGKTSLKQYRTGFRTAAWTAGARRSAVYSSTSESASARRSRSPSSAIPSSSSRRAASARPACPRSLWRVLPCLIHLPGRARARPPEWGNWCPGNAPGRTVGKGRNPMYGAVRPTGNSRAGGSIQRTFPLRLSCGGLVINPIRGSQLHAQNPRLWGLAAVLVIAAAFASTVGISSARAASCTPTGFVRDNIDLTAALINPTTPVTGTMDATGCNIGVYFGSGERVSSWSRHLRRQLLRRRRQRGSRSTSPAARSTTSARRRSTVRSTVSGCSTRRSTRPGRHWSFGARER